MTAEKGSGCTADVHGDDSRTPDPLTRPCSKCNALPGETCVVVGTQVTRGMFHKERGVS